jgi:hypothetical protein
VLNQDTHYLNRASYPTARNSKGATLAAPYSETRPNPPNFIQTKSSRDNWAASALPYRSIRTRQSRCEPHALHPAQPQSLSDFDKIVTLTDHSPIS